MKVLFIGAHTDDVELACGGAIQKLGGYCLPLSYCGNSTLAEEFHTAMKVLGSGGYAHQFTVRQMASEYDEVSKLLYACTPHYDTVFTHDISDVHPDHKTVAEQSLRIFKAHNLLTYLSPWNGNEQPNYFVELTPQQLETKIEALSCYKSQSHRAYMSPDFIKAHAHYMGIKCGKQYAEGFRVIRMLQGL